MSTFAGLLLACIAPFASAESGILQLRIQDSHSHYPVDAVIRGSGPRSFSISTNDRGYARIVLPPGEYQLRISAPDYSPMSTHYGVQPHKTAKLGVFIDPVSLPHEESGEVLNSLTRPGYTLLHEYVLDARTGRPLVGVKVRFLHARVVAKSDSKGHFYLLVPTPAPENPGGLGSDTLIYQKPGYKTIVMKNFGIGDRDMGGTGIEMEKGAGKIVIDATQKLMRK